MRSSTDRRPAQRSDQRREAILDALNRWLQDSDLEAINVAEIAKEAGVTRSAFYFYFENKAAAVAALMEQMVDETLSVNAAFTSATADGSPQERIQAMLDGLFAMWDRHRHLFKAMLEARGAGGAIREIWDGARASFIDSVAAMIRADRATGLAPDGLDAAVLAAVLLEVNDRLLERLTLGGPLTRAQLRDGAAAIWLSTIYGIGWLPQWSQETA
jgi:TetR/AcrR family transcriptional regulator, ethionamide resistance regulator